MNRLFKKTLSLMLVIVMTVSLGVSAAAAGQTGAAQAEGPLGIVSAMSVELNALVEATKISKTEEIAGNTFYEGVLNGVDVVLVKAGIGKVLAASCAETLIDTYHVGGIVFTGIAGGVDDDVNVMDMVIGTSLVQHDYGTETNNGFVWNGEAGSNQETGMIPVDESLSKIAYDSACTVLGAEKVHQGVIATGDQFISSESYVKELQTKFDALACEMEGASVARVADEFHVPCAILRCMSDKADGIAHDTYAFNYTEASNTSASVVKEMLNTIAKDRVALPAAKDVAAKDTTPRTAIISAMSVELKALVDAADIQKDGNTLTVKRMLEDGYMMVKVQTPCLLTCIKELNDPRYMSVNGIFTCYDKPMEVFDYNALKDDPLIEVDTIGLKGSPTNVFKSFTPPQKGAGTMLQGDDVTAQLAGILAKKHLI